MKNILLLTSSPRGEASLSTQVSRRLAAKLLNAFPEAKLVERNLDRNPPPYIGEAFVHAIRTPESEWTVDDRRGTALSDELIAELREADAIVLGSGMINFGIPVPLKAWIDQIARAGQTFSYGPNGPEGLLKGKKLYLVLASGGIYSEGPAQAMNFQRPYLEAVLGFVGLKHPEVILIEGIAYGPDAAEKALAAATARVDTLATDLRPLALV